jgi:hypothetical protein
MKPTNKLGYYFIWQLLLLTSRRLPCLIKFGYVLKNMFVTCKACRRAERKDFQSFSRDVTKNYVNWNILN